jgi:hypothetical protein
VVVVASSGDVAVADMFKFSGLFCLSVCRYFYSCPAVMSIVQSGSDLKWWRLGGVSWKERERRPRMASTALGDRCEEKWDNLHPLHFSHRIDIP